MIKLLSRKPTALRLVNPSAAKIKIFTASFFFSSRRRHTRSISDWSSDVCSSVCKGHLEYEGQKLKGGMRLHQNVWFNKDQGFIYSLIGSEANPILLV